MLVNNIWVIVVIYEIFEENVHIFICLFLPFILQVYLQGLIDLQNGLANVFHLILVDVTTQKNGTAYPIVLAMDIYLIVFVALDEAVDIVNCKDELVEGKIGVHGKA